MTLDKNKEPEKKKENIQDKAELWIDKAEKYIDNAADKMHESETYRKIDKSLEDTTKKIFRKAGRWWGKL
jgi:hypothetical protein